MRKIKLIIVFLVSVLLLCSCMLVEKDEIVEEVEEVEEVELERIEIPESFSIYASGSTESAYESLLGYDETRCTEVLLEGETIVVVVTEEQRQNFITYYEEEMEEVLVDFLESNENYRYEIAEDGREMKFYYDEEIDWLMQARTLATVPLQSGIQQVFAEANSEEWLVHVEIYNCHTGNLVIEYEIPGDSVEFGAEEWEASYNK